MRRMRSLLYIRLLFLILIALFLFVAMVCVVIIDTDMRDTVYCALTHRTINLDFLQIVEVLGVFIWLGSQYRVRLLELLNSKTVVGYSWPVELITRHNQAASKF